MYGSWELDRRIFRRRGCRFGVAGRVVGRVGGGGDLGELREGEEEEKEVEVEVEVEEKGDGWEQVEGEELQELKEEKLEKLELKELEEW